VIADPLQSFTGMRRLLSPRDLAAAIGVSESSLKRWVDAGRIRAVRTEGGHRRIPLADAIRFIRDRRQPVVRPELLGLPDLPPLPSDEPDGDADALHRDLEAGDLRRVRSRILTRYLEGEPIAALCDGPIRTALDRIGELWKESDRGIFIEHRASDLCLQVLAQIRATLEPPAGAPVALGCAPSGDVHLLPSFMAATVLAAEDFEAINLGAETPLTALEAAIEQHAPRLIWLSVMMPPTAEVAAGLARLAGREAAAGRAVIVGGRHAGRLPLRSSAVHLGSSMRELAAFARGLRA
jgi:excisionase family DNA binding protein